MSQNPGFIERNIMRYQLGGTHATKCDMKILKRKAITIKLNECIRLNGGWVMRVCVPIEFRVVLLLAFWNRNKNKHIRNWGAEQQQ